MDELHERRQLTFCERLQMLAVVKDLLEELACGFESASTIAFLVVYARTMTEAGQNPVEVSSIFF